MNIVILGPGTMGLALARRLSFARHDVVVTGRDLEVAAQATATFGGWVRVVPMSEVDSAADVIIAATPCSTQVEALGALGTLSGKTIIDVCNPPTIRCTSFEERSLVEGIARAFPEAKLVKAFNTLSAHDLLWRAGLPVFYAGNDAAANTAAHLLIESICFFAVHAGPLASARYLEAIGAAYTAIASSERAPNRA